MSTPRKSTSSKSRSRLSRPRAAVITPEQIAQIGSLLARIAALEGRVAQLESERFTFPRDNTPFSPFPWRDDGTDARPYVPDIRRPIIGTGSMT